MFVGPGAVDMTSFDPVAEEPSLSYLCQEEPESELSLEEPESELLVPEEPESELLVPEEAESELLVQEEPESELPVPEEPGSVDPVLVDPVFGEFETDEPFQTIHLQRIHHRHLSRGLGRIQNGFHCDLNAVCCLDDKLPSLANISNDSVVV